MTIRLHDSIIINDHLNGTYKVKCSPYSVIGSKGISRSRRNMGQINIVEANVGESQAGLDEQVMPVLVLALLTIRTGNDAFAPFLIVAPLIEVYQKFAFTFISLTQQVREGGDIR